MTNGVRRSDRSAPKRSRLVRARAGMPPARTTRVRAIILGVCLFGAMVAPATAQPDETPPTAAGPAIDVRGRVIAAATGKPVRGARVTVEGTTITTTTAADGSFALAGVPSGASLAIVAEGFDTALVAADRAVLADVALLPAGEGGEVIELSGEAPPAAPGATSLDRDEVAHIPGTGNDVLAALDALPGVTSSPFGPTSFNGVVIRGSAPEDSKILVDGFEIPFLYHTVGFRSILPTESIAGLEYLPGGFDVAYGRASSGIVAVTTRGGGRKLGGQAEVSMLDGGVLGQGPVGGSGSLLVALRRSTIDLILPSLIPDDADLNLTTVPRYWDTQARYDVDLSSRWKLATSMLGSDDVLELFTDDEQDPDKRFFSRARFVRLTADAKYSRDKYAADLAVSGVVQQLQFEFGRMQYFDMVAEGVGVRGEVQRTDLEALGLREVVTRVGGEVNVGRARLDLVLGDAPNEGEPQVGPPDDSEITNRFQGVKWVPDVAAWTAVAAGFGPRARLTTGLRVDGFLRSGDVAVQPRGELQVKLPRKVTARLAAGAYRRPPEYQDEFLDNTIHPEKATQIVAGVEHEPLAGVKVQTSTYFTDRTAILSRGDDGKYHNVGRGRTVGVELLVTLRHGGWFGWVSYALSKSTRIDRPGERERLFDYDQPHDLNLAVSWKGKKWQLGGRFTYKSGQPYTPVIGAVFDSDNDRYLPVFGDINSERVQAHHQLDVRIDRMFRAGPVKLSAFLDVQNVYLNSSIAGYGYNFDYSERWAFESIPILPSLGIKGEL